MLAGQKSRFILLHADYSGSNLVRSSGSLIPIDFSLSGYALLEMDLADMIINFDDKTLTVPFRAGDHSVSPFTADKRNLDFYSAFSVLMYLGYHHERESRNVNFSERLDRWCNRFFDPVVEDWQEQQFDFASS